MMNFTAIALSLVAASHTQPSATDDSTIISVLDNVPLRLDRSLGDSQPREGYTLRRDGRVAETTVDLPPAPENLRDAMQIVARVHVTPTLVEADGGYRPGDPWPRIGKLSVLVAEDESLREVELMRFITGFGGEATFTQDLTALAPLLHGRQTLRVLINTYSDPAWEVSVDLRYNEEGAGYRRPALALPAFNKPHVTAEDDTCRATVVIPEGLQRPRLRILTTGHATDGRGGDEFVPRTHILRVDGEEVARWRPWAEHGNDLRDRNPASGRAVIDGRELWSSEFDRSGWHPGLLVQPLYVPLWELTPGEHELELEIENIRPAVDPDSDEEEDSDHGYWSVSAMILADEPWPDRPGIRRGGQEN